MKVRTMVIILAVMLGITVPVFASAYQGTPTSKSLITADLFPTGSQGTIGNCSYLNVRQGPGIGYRAFTYLAKGDVITVLEYSEKWILIDTPKGQGWIYAGYVLNDTVNAAVGTVSSSSVSYSSVGRPTPVGLISSDMFPVGSQATVSFCYFLNVRSGPDKSYKAFTTVARNDVITVLEYSQKWVLIDTPAGQGWIYTGYLHNDQVSSKLADSRASGSSSSVGYPTPIDLINADMFPVDSQKTVDYCYFLNVRRGPAPSYSAFTYLARGDVISVLEYSQKWVLIDTARGQGWIYAGYLSRD